MAKLLIVGHLAINKTHTPFGTSTYFGGAGYHVAWAAAQMLPKREVALVSVCGKDFDLSHLEKSGVDITRVSVLKNINSDIFVIREWDGERTFRSYGQLFSAVSLSSLSESFFRRVRWVHFASSPPSQQLDWYHQLPGILSDKKNWSLSSDTFELFAFQSPEEVIKIFNLSGLVFVNNREWGLINGRIDQRIPVVLKKGKDGAAYLCKEKKMYYNTLTPPIKKVVDTVGAGEVFAGIFLALKVRGFSPERALGTAVRVASWSVEDFGIEHLSKDERFCRLISQLNKENV